jgi:precorrin-6Y C5,15-methyltransferase (decarboxylating) CbiT subunit
MVPGVPDECFFRPDEGPEVMTRQEVRSVVLGKLHLRLKPGEVVWDIGAGLGTVAIEAAVLRPYVEVVAVEADPTRLPLLKKNRDRFAAWNLRVLEGKAPEALAAEALPPSRVFIGGSGGRLADILDLVCERLPVHGILVANFVTLDHLALALAHLKARDWSPHVTEIHVSRSVEIADLTSLKPQRPIFIVDAQKPDVTRE